jgi:hypothetical protein
MVAIEWVAGRLPDEQPGAADGVCRAADRPRPAGLLWRCHLSLWHPQGLSGETAPGANLYVPADLDVRTQFEPDFRLSADPVAIEVVIAASHTALDYDGLTLA